MAAAAVGGALQAFAGARRGHQPCASLDFLQSRSVGRKEEPVRLGRSIQSRPPVAAPGRRSGDGKSVKGRGWKDPFDYGSTDDVEYGDVLSEGKQNPEGLGLEHEEDNPYGSVQASRTCEGFVAIRTNEPNRSCFKELELENQ